MSTTSFGPVSLVRIGDSPSSPTSLVTSPHSHSSSFLALSADAAHLLFQEEGVEVRRVSLSSVSLISLTSSSFLCRPLNDAISCIDSLVIKFPSQQEASLFHLAVVRPREKGGGSRKNGPSGDSVFDKRTEDASASQYFQFYGYLSQQQNMMQDYVRTATYQRAMLANAVDFRDKIVMDVGAGSGILSFFAVQAGARKVYAVEASSMAKHCESLVWSNGLSEKIQVLAGKMEEVQLPEHVDMIISEPMGYMLLNERMLESFLHAKKFLKPGGRMFPSRGDLHLALFSDEALYLEQSSKASFWCQESFHGVNLSFLRPCAVKEYFKQPVVDTWHIATLLTQSHKWTVDFGSADEKDLHLIDIPFDLMITKPGVVHGIAFWFDVAFIGGSQTVWLSTAPTEPLTHWYQVRCLLERPLIARLGQVVSGRVVMKANDRQSYDVDIEVTVDGNCSRNSLDLKNPYFRYTGQPVQPPPGNCLESPSDAYWQSLNAYQAPAIPGAQVNGVPVVAAAANLVNGAHHAANSNIMDLLANAHAVYRGGQMQTGSSAQTKSSVQPSQHSPHSMLFTQANHFGQPSFLPAQGDPTNPVVSLANYRPWGAQ